VTDIVDIFALGILPLQQHRWDKEDLDLDERHVLQAVRIKERDLTVEKLAHHQPIDETGGDIIGSFVWLPAIEGAPPPYGPAMLTRFTSAWSMGGFPSIVSRRIRNRLNHAEGNLHGGGGRGGGGSGNEFAHGTPGATFTDPVTGGTFGATTGGIPGATFTDPTPPTGGMGGGGAPDKGGGGTPVETASPGSTSSPPSVLPIFDGSYVPDSRFATEIPFVPGDDRCYPKLAGGAIGMIVPATREDFQVPLWMHCDPRLIAVHADGDWKIGSIIADLNSKDEIDPERCARLQTIFRVIKDPSSCANFHNENSIAWNITETGRKDGHGGIVTDKPFGEGAAPKKPPKEAPPVPTKSGGAGSAGAGLGSSTPGAAAPAPGVQAFGHRHNTKTGVHGEQAAPLGGPGTDGAGETMAESDRVHAMMSQHQSGPFVTGATDDQHKQGVDADGNPINPGHLSTNSLFWRSKEFDAPLLFEGKFDSPVLPPPPVFRAGIYCTHVSLELSNLSHATCKGAHKGMWKWRSQLNDYMVYDGEPPPSDGVPPPKEPPGVPTGGGIPGGGESGGGTFSNAGDSGPIPGFPQGPGNPFDQPNPFGDGGTAGEPGGVPLPPQALLAPLPPPPVQGPVIPTDPEETSLPIIASTMERAYPALLGRPQYIGERFLGSQWHDLRHWSAPTEKTIRILDHFTPISYRLEAFAKQRDDSFVYTDPPGNARYVGGTADGGGCIFPAELQMADIINGVLVTPDDIVPSLTELGVLVGSYFATGTPSTRFGQMINAHRWGRVGVNTVVESVDSAAAVVAISRWTSGADYQFETQLGQGGAYASMIGSLFENLTTVGTDANLLVKTLQTRTLPANSLNNVGKGLRVRAWGTFAAEGSAKNLHLLFDAVVLATNDIVTNPNGLSWELEGVIEATGAASQTATFRGNVGAVKQGTKVQSLAGAFGSPHTVSVTGQNSIPVANGVVCNGMLIEAMT